MSLLFRAPLHLYFDQPGMVLARAVIVPTRGNSEPLRILWSTVGTRRFLDSSVRIVLPCSWRTPTVSDGRPLSHRARSRRPRGAEKAQTMWDLPKPGGTPRNHSRWSQPRSRPRPQVGADSNFTPALISHGRGLEIQYPTLHPSHQRRTTGT